MRCIHTATKKKTEDEKQKRGEQKEDLKFKQWNIITTLIDLLWHKYRTSSCE